jgi:signal transduction histidine kinase
LEDKGKHMSDNHFINISQELTRKDEKIKQLKQKIIQVEKKLNELNKNLEQRVIDRTVEVNKLIRDKARFIDNLSHDLATPLTPIISLLPIVKENLSDEKSLEIINTCIRNAEYIKRVVNNARELAELSATELLLKKENLFEILDVLLRKYNVVFKSKNIKVENEISQEIFIKTEKNRLLQLFDNITSNAVNSMPDGGTLTFESKAVTKDSGTFYKISAKDTGVGLSRDQTDHLFDEFYKTDESRHKLDSTGLGLTICKSIIEKHGGKIWADSHGGGKGTTIHFTIPSNDVIFSRSFL